jgi:hypothetical protein
LKCRSFSKLESELETDFDKWMYVFKNLHLLDKIPTKLQSKIFSKLFGEAELAKLKPMDKLAYEESLKVYRDLKAVTDTAYEDGYKEAESLLTSQLEEERRQKEEAIKKQEEERRQKEEERRQKEEERRQKEALIKTLSKTMSIEEMANLLGVPEDFIRSIVD